MEFENIHEWIKYEPRENHYVKYPTYITAAMFQVGGVYETLCRARVSLEYTTCNNYGELIYKSDESHLSFIRKTFIENAIIYYNICIDLSWQVLWLYSEADNLEMIYNEKNLNEVLRNCNYNELLYRLKLGVLENIIEKLNEFDGYVYRCGIRTKYNYIKHRGV